MPHLSSDQASTSTTTLHPDSMIRYKVSETSRERRRKTSVEWEVTGEVSTLGQRRTPTFMSWIHLANIPIQRMAHSHRPSKRFTGRRMLCWTHSVGRKILAILPISSTVLVYNTTYPTFQAQKSQSMLEIVLTAQNMQRLQMGENLRSRHRKPR